jgi:ABC-type Fe3+ transport system substrate-binding protein
MQEGAGLVSQFGGLTLVNRAAHPNAAKVFINWYLSREGQLTLQRVIAKAGDGSVVPDSLRIDIPKDDIPLENRRVQGVKYLDLDTPERIEYEPILKVVEDGLAKAGKR